MPISTYDLYEASYYLLHGCELETVEALRLGREVRCRMSFSGPRLEALQVTYLGGQAEANLFAFRRVYAHLSAVILKAKRKAQNRLKNGGQIPVLGPEGSPREIL